MPTGNDADATTIGGYLVALLAALWERGEEFSGKRPLGNSGWRYDLYEPLARAGFIQGSYDADWGWDDVDTFEGDKLIKRAIQALTSDERTP
jgi:hypothetical protein